jgi:selenocysteine-specific elongation factor
LDSINFDKKILNTTGKEFLFSIDHCFNIKNKGTIVTGTILKGKASINDEIYFPELCEKKVIKEMQMFKKPIAKAFQGDRVGMLIKNLDHTKLERSLACNEGFVQNINGGIFILRKIPHYKHEIKSNSKFYVIIGNQGVMARCLFFSRDKVEDIIYKDFNNDNVMKTSVNLKYFYNNEYKNQEYLTDNSEDYIFAYLKFDNSLLMPPDMILLGSKIDFDVSHKSNRIAFYGKMVDKLNESDNKKLKVYKMKTKSGSILRMTDENIAVVKGLFKKDSNVEDFVGKKVTILESEGKVVGTIQCSFGQAGKVKVVFGENVREMKLSNNDGKEIDFNSFTIQLEYKKYVKYK